MELTKRQSEITGAALKLISEGGIRHLTMKNLSQAIGVTEPAVYRHFKNKSAIVKALIGQFDQAVSVKPGLSGFDAVAAFVRGRIGQVCAHPELARVMFAEELFMDDPEFSGLMMEMMHRHKKMLSAAFEEACRRGELRADIAPDMMFRIVMGPVRLLIKQWGMTRGAFDLPAQGEELLEDLYSMLKKGGTPE